MIKVVYCSKGGNTKKLADAMAESIGVHAENVSEKLDPEQAELLFIGASVYAGKMAPKMQAYLSALKPGAAERVVVFGTGFTETSMRDAVAAILADKNIPVEAEAFCCKGSFLLANRGKPDADDCRRAAAFAANLAQSVR